MSDSLERLETKQLVFSLPMTKKRLAYSLSFNGMLLFLYHFWNHEAFKYFYNSYNKLRVIPHRKKRQLAKIQALEKIMPLLPLWETIAKEFPEEALKALEKTVNLSYLYNTTPIEVKFLDLIVNDFLMFDDLLLTEKKSTPIINKSNNLVFLLANDKFSLLHESYLANIIRKEITSRKSQEEIISILQNEAKELPFLSNSLSLKDLLNKLFPKYDSIEYFFTGLFAKNLFGASTQLSEANVCRESHYKVY